MVENEVVAMMSEAQTDNLSDEEIELANLLISLDELNRETERQHAEIQVLKARSAVLRRSNRAKLDELKVMIRKAA